MEVYASRSERRYDGNPKSIAQNLVKDVLPAGFHALKAHTHPPALTPVLNADSRMDIDPTIEEIAEIRRLAGPQIKIMVDCYNAYTSAQAIKVGRKLQDLDAFFMEEPVAVLTTPD